MGSDFKRYRYPFFLLRKTQFKENKHERYYEPGRRPLAYLLTLVYAYGKPRLCINIHHYAPPIGSTAQCRQRRASSCNLIGCYRPLWC